MRLAVELAGTLIGTIEGDARAFDFHPSDEGMGRFGVNSTVLSVAIPLSPRARRDHATRRRIWFEELLPEGDQYDYMLTQGGLARGDTPRFLARYGRDVAGALQIWDANDPTEPLTPELRPLSEARIRSLLESPLRSPLGNDRGLGKSSLGGVQPKIVLTRTPEGWAQALGGSASSHIVKPRLAGENSTVIFDEEYGARVTKRIGLAAHDTSIHDFDGLPALVIERFDRIEGDRLHQEDFSQALGARGNQKYQEIGGVVSLRRVAEVLRRAASSSDLARLADMTTAAVALGNLDQHTKNLALLHPLAGDARLAPAYDFVPQAHLSRDGRMALAVNRVYRHADITAEDLVAEITSWGLRDADERVASTLADLASAVAAEAPSDGAFPGLHDDVAGFIDNLRSGRPVS